MTETGVGVTGEGKAQEAAQESEGVCIVTETVNKKFLTFGVRENPPFHISFIYAIQVRFQLLLFSSLLKISHHTFFSALRSRSSRYCQH